MATVSRPCYVSYVYDRSSNEVGDYTLCWDDRLETGETLADSVWIQDAADEDDYTIEQQSFTDNSSTVRISGPASGVRWLENLVTTSTGQVLSEIVAMVTCG